MSKAFILLVLCVISSAGQTASVGSSNAPSGSSRSHRGAAPGGERAMTGCLTTDEAGTYFLQTRRNAKVKLDSAEDLASRIGRLIKVTGAFVDTHSTTSSGASAANRANPSEQPPSVRVFRVFKVDVLSQTCSSRKK